MEIVINNNTVIKEAKTKTGRKTISIDGYILTKNDTIIYNCSKCGEKQKQLFLYKEKFINKVFLCKDCMRKKTNIEKYGVEYILQSEEIRNKIKKTNIEKYGIEIPSKDNLIRKTIGKKNKKNSLIANEKRKQTNLEKYGVEYVWQNKDIKEKIKQTNLEKYGVKTPSKNEEIKEKIKQTNLEKYGVEYGLQNTDVRNKIKQTNLERYGIDHNFKIDGIREKIKKTWIENYNVDNPWKSSDIINKIKETKLDKYGNYNNYEKVKQTNLERYGFYSPAKNEEVINKAVETRKKETFYRLLNSDRLQNKVKPLFTVKEYSGVNNLHRWKCERCKTEFKDTLINGHIPRCPICYPPLSGTSKYEKELYDWLQSLNVSCIQNDRTVLGGKELDLYLPDYNLAIEFDGLYWHSELQGKNQNYHLNKTLECKKQNIQLIHIFEDEWLNKQDVVKSVIKGKLGLTNKLYARKCIIKEINDNQKEFLDRNHLQGHINSSVNIGLHYNNELISLLTFGKSRYNNQYDWEILRFVNKLDTSIIGGFAKMLSYFEKHYNGSIITYSDRRYFDGSIYRNNGFEKLGISKPNYFYTDYKNRYSRIQYQKHKLEEQLEVYDSDLTEWENMQLNGWDRIWDCGNYSFSKQIK